MKALNIRTIRIDGGTQSRVAINEEVVAEYATALKEGADFPEVVVFHDGADYWLADGFHRYHAHNRIGKASIAADVQQGTVRDAILYSLGANRAHGLQRSNADKRKTVMTLLADPEWAAWSDRKIAEVAGVGHPLVAAIRKPEVAAKQQENRLKSATKQVHRVESDSTPPESRPQNRHAEASVSATAEQPEALSEAHEAVGILTEENERLNDRLAVDAMDASEEEKALCSETIASLRSLNKTLTAELKAVKASRDEYMRENGELKKQIKSQRAQLDKLKA